MDDSIPLNENETLLSSGITPDDWLDPSERSLPSNSNHMLSPSPAPTLSRFPSEALYQSIERSPSTPASSEQRQARMSSPSVSSLESQERTKSASVNAVRRPQEEFIYNCEEEDSNSQDSLANGDRGSSENYEEGVAEDALQVSAEKRKGISSPSIFGNPSSSGSSQPSSSRQTNSPSRKPTAQAGPSSLKTTQSIENSTDDALAKSQAALQITEIEDDDDFDFMIIDSNTASPEAQRKWKESGAVARIVIDDDDEGAGIIKQEEKGDTDLSLSPPPTPRSTAKKPRNAQEISAAAQARLNGSNKNSRLKKTAQEMFADSQAILRGENSILQKDPEFHRGGTIWNEDSEASGSGTRNPRKRVLDEILNLDDERRQMGLAMQDGEDHSWMDEEPEDDGEFDNLTTLCSILLKRKKHSRLGGDDAAELYKVQRRLQLLTRLRATSNGEVPHDEGEEDANSLFIPENRDVVLDRHIRRQPRPRQSSIGSVEVTEGLNNDDSGSGRPRHGSHGSGELIGGMDDDDGAGDFGGQDDDDDEHVAFCKMLEQELNGDGIDRANEGDLTKNGKPRKKRGKMARDSREVFAQDQAKRREKEREKERKKAQKKKGKEPASIVPKKPTKGKGKAVAKSKKGQGAKRSGVIHESESLLRSGKSMFNHNNGQDDVGQKILEDLMNNDPIAERLQNPIFDQSAEPEIHGPQVKATQLQRLFANIPEGSNKATARSDKALLQQASRSFGYGRCKAQDGKWLVKGMSSTLYHHQLLGAQWMVERELSDDAPHGGLLADSMGLGKTVQTLACMVANPPMAEDKKRKVKATLIVVPAAVIDQWIDEIKYHTFETTFPKVVRYKGSSSLDVNILEDLDIVVTSYNEVMKQFPIPTKEERVQIDVLGYKKWWRSAIQRLGVLHQVNWYRVVLDEAHAIKNNSAKQSLACQNLKSVYRWCLTGTPLLNRLEELFPYLRFLKANYSMDWNTFQRYFCDPHADDCQSRIATLLSYTMMRRTMKTTILNRPIIMLPMPHPFMKYIQFSPEEKIIYRITENRFRSNLNLFFKSGDAAKNYGVFMVQLLRLRQCTSHPFMLERTIKEAWTLEDIHELKVRLRRLGSDRLRPFYQQTKAWVEQNEAEREEARQKGETIGLTGENGGPLPFGQGEFGCNFDMGKALSTLNEKELWARVVCGICSDLPNMPKQTECGHIFCEECILGVMHSQLSEGSEYNTCPTCDKLFRDLKNVRGLENDSEDEGTPDADEVTSPTRSGKRQKKSDSKGVDMMGFEPKTKDSTWVSKSDSDPEFDLAPSAKTVALKAILLKGFKEAPLDKVVIYVQFRTLARIVGRICQGEDWGFVYLTGDTSLAHRTRAIKKFRDDPDVRILIAGLKCGGLGLNFPWANRCISLDLWWNHAVEQQAFSRIFRIGQEKETYMTRIVVRDSVDMRLLTMQIHKLEACEKAMQNGEDKEKPNLSLSQLANLFGFLKTNEDGAILSIEADYEDAEEWKEGGRDNDNS